MVINTMIGLMRKRLILKTVKDYASAYKVGIDSSDESPAE
jgi:hypothetical protein